MSHKSVDNYPHAMELAPKNYKTQKKYNKAVDTYPSTTKYVPDWFQNQESRNVNSETAIHIKLLTWHNTFEKHKTRTNDINKQLMLIAWYP